MRTLMLGVALLLASGCGSNVEFNMSIDGGEVPFRSVVADIVDRGEQSAIVRVVGELDLSDSSLQDAKLMFEVALDPKLMEETPQDTEVPIQGSTRYQPQLPGIPERSDPSYTPASANATLVEWALLSQICPTCSEPRGGSQEFSGNLQIQDRSEQTISLEIQATMTGRIANRDTTERAVVTTKLTLDL